MTSLFCIILTGWSIVTRHNRKHINSWVILMLVVFNLFQLIWNYMYILYNFSTRRWCNWLKYFLLEDENQVIPYSQYHNTMAADGMVTQRARALVAMVLALFARNISVSVPGWLICYELSIFGYNFSKTNTYSVCRKTHLPWYHQMETFSALLVLCAGNSPVTAECHISLGGMS